MRGCVITLTGEFPTIYVNAFFPCEKRELRTTSAEGTVGEDGLMGWARQAGESLVAGHLATCPDCRRATCPECTKQSLRTIPTEREKQEMFLWIRVKEEHDECEACGYRSADRER